MKETDVTRAGSMRLARLARLAPLVSLLTSVTYTREVERLGLCYRSFYTLVL
jgi:hypothetical protein